MLAEDIKYISKLYVIMQHWKTMKYYNIFLWKGAKEFKYESCLYVVLMLSSEKRQCQYLQEWKKRHSIHHVCPSCWLQVCIALYCSVLQNKLFRASYFSHTCSLAQTITKPPGTATHAHVQVCIRVTVASHFNQKVFVTPSPSALLQLSTV